LKKNDEHWREWGGSGVGPSELEGGQFGIGNYRVNWLDKKSKLSWRHRYVGINGESENASLISESLVLRQATGKAGVDRLNVGRARGGRGR